MVFKNQKKVVKKKTIEELEAEKAELEEERKALEAKEEAVKAAEEVNEEEDAKEEDEEDKEVEEPKEEAKPKEKFMVVKEIPTQAVRQIIDKKTGDRINLITIEEALTDFMNRGL